LISSVELLFANTVAGKMVDQFFAPRPIKVFYIPSGAMWPTLPVGTELIVNQMIPNSQIRVGDILTFIDPKDADTIHIFRLMGVAGDKIQIKHGNVFINGVMLIREKVADKVGTNHFGKDITVPCYIETNKRTPYEVCQIDNDDGVFSNTKEYIVPSSHLFFLGDNRDNSSDSRLSTESGGIGYVPIENLTGKAYFALYPRDLGYLYKSILQ
jgi:signal peptidase I